MAHSKSILPVDHWTTGLSDEQLRGLVARHAVRYEIGPNHVVGAEGQLLRHGWLVDLYGSRSAADRALASDEATHHVHDVLHTLAKAVVPDEAGPITIHLEDYNGAVHLDPKRNFAVEVRLRIVIEPDTLARMSLIAGGDTDQMEAIAKRFQELGVKASR